MNYSNFAEDSHLQAPARQASGLLQQPGVENFSSFGGRGGGGNTAPAMETSSKSAMPKPLLGGGGGGRPGPTMKEITIDPDNLVIFHGRNNALSTFYEAPVMMAGYKYPTLQHYYEANKVYALVGPREANDIRQAQRAGEVKSLAKKALRKIPKQVVDQWKTSEGLSVMRLGLMEKFRQHPYLREQLMFTGDKILAEADKFDKIWAVGLEHDDLIKWFKEHKGETVTYPTTVEPATIEFFPMIGDGKNLLGWLLHYVRTCLRLEMGLSS